MRALSTLAEAAIGGDATHVAEVMREAYESSIPKEDHAQVEMIDARVAFANYFVELQRQFSVLEGHVPAEPDDDSGFSLSLADFGDNMQEFAEHVEGEFDRVTEYLDNRAETRDFSSTALHDALVNGEPTAKRIMTLIVSGDYFGLDTVGRVIDASQTTMLAVLKTVQELAEVVHEQGAVGVRVDDQSVLGQVVQNTFDEGHRQISHALEGLLPASETNGRVT